MSRNNNVAGMILNIEQDDSGLKNMRLFQIILISF